MGSSLDSVQLHLVDSAEDAGQLMTWLSTVQGALAVDTETTGLSQERDHVRLIQVGDDTHGWAMRSDRWGGVFDEVTRRWDGEYVLHNSSFDVGLLGKWGNDLDRSHCVDTMLMAHVLHPNESKALKRLSNKYIDPRASAMQRSLDEAIGKSGGWTWATIPIVTEGPLAVYWQYAALDTVLTRKLHDILRPRVEAESPAAFQLENSVIWPVFNMERRGAKVDREYTERFSDQFLKHVAELEAWCLENYGVKAGSNQDVIKILQGEGIEFTKLTAAGSLSLDKEVLAGIDHPLARAVLGRRKVQKLQSTYLRRFLEYTEYDGLLHPGINTVGLSQRAEVDSSAEIGVRTSRMSMDTPNLQQLPRHGTSPAADVVRNCIVTRYNEGSLLMCDFDQVEMRIMAHLSEDPRMLEAFHQPLDFFTTMGRDIYGDLTFQKSDPRRQIIKNSGYAKAYCAGIETFARTAQIPETEAARFMARFDSLYPGVDRFIRNTIDEVEKRRTTEGELYTRSPLTNRKLVPDDRRAYSAVNYKIQCMAAEIFKSKILELDAAGLGEFMILPVHDEIILDVPAENRADVITTLRDVMNDHQLLSVPLTAGLAEGKRWGEKKELEWDTV